MSSSNCCFLTCIQISQEADQVVWYSHLFQNIPQFVVIHTVKGFGVVNKAEVDVFLELSCFFDDAADVGSLISGSSAFSKTSLNIWKFPVHVLLKPGLEDFEHYLPSVWDECSCAASELFGRGLLQAWSEHCPPPGQRTHWAQRSRSSVCRPETAQLPPLRRLCPVRLPEAACLGIPGCLAPGEWSHRHGYLGHEDLLCIVLCIPATSSYYLMLLLGPYHFFPLLSPSLHEMFLWYL